MPIMYSGEIGKILSTMCVDTYLFVAILVLFHKMPIMYSGEIGKILSTMCVDTYLFVAIQSLDLWNLFLCIQDVPT